MNNKHLQMKQLLKRMRYVVGLVLLASFWASGINAQVLTKTTTAGNGTWTCPSGVTQVIVETWGAGGGGGVAGISYGVAGAGAGGSYTKTLVTVVPGTTYNYTVGAGGTAGTTAGAAGGLGGSSYFGNTTAGSSTGAVVLSVGGKGGSGVTASGSPSTYTVGAAGAAVTTGDVYPSTSSFLITNTYGAAATAATTAGVGSKGAAGANGGAGGGSATTTGNAGTAPGGGGSGAKVSTGSAAVGGVGGNGAIAISYSSLTISDNGTPSTASNVGLGSSKNVLQSFVIANSTAVATALKSVIVHLYGNYQASDLAYIKIYSNTTNSLATASLVASAASASTNLDNTYNTFGIENLTLSATTNNTVAASGNTYFWVCSSIAPGANVGTLTGTTNTTVRANALSSSDFAFTASVAPASIVSASANQGGTQTIIQGVSAYLDDIINQPAGNIIQNTTVALAGFTINPNGTSTKFDSVAVFGNGSATATDLTNLAIYVDANSNGILDAGDYKISTTTPTYSTSQTVPMGFRIDSVTLGNFTTKKYFLIVATVADVLVSTPGNSVQLSINDGGFVTTITGANNMNGANFLTIHAPTGTATLVSTSAVATISSVAASSNVYSFTINNSGSNTNAATLISQMVINQGALNTVTNWSNVLGTSATLTDNSGNTATGTVAATSITFSGLTTTSGKIGYIAHGTSKTYSLKIAVSNAVPTASQPIANQQFVFEVDSSSFTTTGSQLGPKATTKDSSNNSTISGIVSTSETITVIATKLAYISSPISENVSTNLAPAIKVQAVDANGNYALNWTTPISLSSTPAGLLDTSSTSGIASGAASFNRVSFGTTGTYTVTASSTGLTSVTSSSIIISNGLYLGLVSGTSTHALWENAVWATSGSGTTGTNWVDDGTYAATFNTVSTKSQDTLNSNHTVAGITFNQTGVCLVSTNGSAITFAGANPSINVTSSDTIDAPINVAAGANLTYNVLNPSTLATYNPNNKSQTTVNLGNTTNHYVANYGTGATTTFSGGLTNINFYASNPLGNSSNTAIIQTASGVPILFGTAGASAVFYNMPISVSNNITFQGNYGQISIGPTGASTFGNLIKYMGVFSGNILGINMSNNGGFTTTGKGYAYLGAKNTFNGSTLIFGNTGCLIMGVDTALPSNTDAQWWVPGTYSSSTVTLNGVTSPSATTYTGGVGPNGLNLLDIHHHNIKVASINTTTTADSSQYVNGVSGALNTPIQNLVSGGVFSSDTLLPTITAGTAANTGMYGSGGTYINAISYVTLAETTPGTANPYYKVGDTLMANGIPYGTRIVAIYPNRTELHSDKITTVLCDSIVLSDTIRKNSANTVPYNEYAGSISSPIGAGNFGFYVFTMAKTQNTLSIGSAANTGFHYGVSDGHVLDHTNATFGGRIYGNLGVTLTSDNDVANKLTLLNGNTYNGPTNVNGGTLVLARKLGNTIPATNTVSITGTNAGDTSVLEIASNQTLASVTLGAFGTLKVDAGDTLTITGSFTNTGGTVYNNGTIIYGGSSFTLNGATINNNAKFNVTAGNFNVAAGTFNNNAGDSLTVTNNIINITGGLLKNAGGLLATSNVSVTGGTFEEASSLKQTVNNVSLTSVGGLKIDNNDSLNISGTLTYGVNGNFQNSGVITYGTPATSPTGSLVYAYQGNLQINNNGEFLAGSYPASLTIALGDTLYLDQDYQYTGSVKIDGYIKSLPNSIHYLELQGTSQSISGKGSIAYLRYNKVGGTLTNTGTDSLKIISVLAVPNGTLASNGFLTFKSTSLLNSAVFEQVLGNASNPVTGNVVVERFIPKGYRAYRDMAPEVYGAGSIFNNWQEGGSFTKPGYGIFITGPSATDSAHKTYFNAPTVNSFGLDYSLYGNSSAYTYNNVIGSFTGDASLSLSAGQTDSIYNTKSTYLDPFKGYRVLVRGDRTFNLEKTPVYAYGNNNLLMLSNTTLRAVGKLITGSVSYSTTGVTATAADGTAAASTNGLNNNVGGFSMVTNPYVCPVLWGNGNGTINNANSTVYGASTNINGSYWYLDPTTTSVGHYVAYNALSGASQTYNASTTSYSNYTNTGAVVGTGYIQPGQAFFVQTIATGPTVGFAEGAKLSAAPKVSVFGVTKPLSKIYVALNRQDTIGKYSKVASVAVAFNENFGNTTYGAQDALAINASTDNLTISDKNKSLSIDGRLPATNSDVLSLSLDKPSSVAYQLEIDATNYNGLTPTLEDNYTGTSNALSIGVNTIDITVDPSVAASYANRFSIIFKPGALAVNSVVASASLNNKVATITWNTVGEKKVTYFEVQKSTDGNTFTKVGQATAKNTATASYSLTDNNVTSTTYYRIKVVSETGNVTYSNVAKIATIDAKLVNIYPNPLRGKILNVELGSLAAGKYVVSIYSTLGQKVHEEIISHQGGNGTHAIKIDHTFASGVYTVTISDASSRKVVCQSSLSVQP